ncbi:MAG: sulfide/dihydroorotate dehydrogenase-like FAD/NAD-binding protein [Candidatus Methanogaster sp.]|uniref:Sulfide/dihydroorotate dehydrogenase-like FAD/NAD-binding protein n=1 Tax=Candidatus Methanogaster sp. TaxID=3386292 RepID=A0AC61L1Q7_9EURY|nr:MAG: sulfide/dihydroorotate dehydrogenase-like FAD/NAD-binding protein [ANME-2 cluster archaeon]
MPFTILKKQELVPTLHRMDIAAPRVAEKAMPGQFVILRIDECGERIPLTIADFDAADGTVTLIFQEIGKTTCQLASLGAGDSIADLAGPLGCASTIEKFGTVVCVGGGVGIAPIFPIARGLMEAGNKVISIIGARSADILFWEERMKEASSELYVTTDDGTKGHHGFVTDIVQNVIESGEQVDRVIAIGPPVMMRAVAGVTKPFGIKTVVSLNPIMVDGTGMCGACRVLVGGVTKFACVDGPEFDAHEVDFTLLMSRLAMYLPEEREALDYKAAEDPAV